MSSARKDAPRETIFFAGKHQDPMLPQSGRSLPTDYDANDTWDKYEPKSEQTLAKPPVSASRFGGTPATNEAMVAAWASSNATQALTDNLLFDAGHKSARLQNKQRAYDSYDRNILPGMATSTLTTPETYYLGGPNAIEREKRGKFVDRLGNEYDIYENKVPPPNKDYSSCAAATSHRHLERCQGGNPYFTDRPKKEVKHVSNPAEARGDGQYLKERSNIEELKGRQTYFNQSGMQTSSAFDTTRDQYDGYNVKTDYKDLVHAVEPCWRATIVTEQERRAEPNQTLQASPSAEVYLRRTEGVGAFQRKPMQTPATVSAGKARITLPFISEATPRAHIQSEGSERRAAHTSYGANATARVLDVNEKADMPAMENRRAQAQVQSKVADPEVTLVRDDAYAIDTIGNATLPVAFSASLADITRNDTDRENAMVTPKPSRNWSMIQKIAEDFDREAEDDMEISELTNYASSHVEASTMLEKDTDHRIRNDVVKNSVDVPDVTVAAGRARAEKVTRAGKDVSDNIVEPRVEHVVLAPPKKSKRTRLGRDEMNQTYEALQQSADGEKWRSNVCASDDRTQSPEIDRYQIADLGERVQSTVLVHRDDVATRDDARASNSVPQSAPRETVTITDKNRQQDGTTGARVRELDGAVRSNVVLDDERAHFDVQMAPVREVGDVARSHVSIRTTDRASTNRVGLAVSEVAEVHMRPRNDALISNRTFTNRAIQPVAEFDQGDRVAGAVNLGRVEKGLSRYNHADAANIGSTKYNDAPSDRPVEARATYGSLATTKNQASQVLAGTRTMPAQLTSYAGLTSTCRIDSKSAQMGANHMVRPESALQKHERCTPTRALTPGFNTDSRWTPTLQQNGNSRDSTNQRAFVGGDLRFRASTPDIRVGGARDIPTPCEHTEL